MADAICANESLADLRWNYDLAKSPSQAKAIVSKIAGKHAHRSNKLLKVSICGVFTSKATREELRALFPADCGMTITLFEPSFTDEESEDMTSEESEA